MKPVVVVVGTRPEIIKMAPIIRALKKTKFHMFLFIAVNTTTITWRSNSSKTLELPTPDYSFKIEASSPGAQTAEIMLKTGSSCSRKLNPQLFWLKATQTRFWQQHWRQTNELFRLDMWRLGCEVLIFACLKNITDV